jgi:hypothetical protein
VKLAQLKKPLSATMRLYLSPIETEQRLMACVTRRARKNSDQSQSFLGCLSYFLTPQVWRQAHGALRHQKWIRWQPQPLIFVLLTMTWCSGESVAERFETAKAFYVASYQRKRRPGKTVEGFQKALARVPTPALRQVAAAVRCRLAQVFAKRFETDGFVPLGCDGSRLDCPRTPELQKRLLSKKGKKRKYPPQIMGTAFVHLSLGLLWSWCLGGVRASEQKHLVQLLATLPLNALIVADAGYVGYALLQKLQVGGHSFLIRLSSAAPLYVTEKIALSRFREGQMYYWPQKDQKRQKPIPVRVLRIRGRKADVWLMTNVDAERLPLPLAEKFYRWRWRNEGLFRTYKRTLGKVKLMGRTVCQVHREAEGSLLAVQLLLAHGVLALPLAGQAGIQMPAARHVLLEIRVEIRNVTGMYLGPRQRRSYLERLKGARTDRRRNRKNKVRYQWPTRAPHKAPKPPRILKMGTILKDLLVEALGAA